jgi:hypothetical protein
VVFTSFRFFHCNRLLDRYVSIVNPSPLSPASHDSASISARVAADWRDSLESAACRDIQPRNVIALVFVVIVVGGGDGERVALVYGERLARFVGRHDDKVQLTFCVARVYVFVYDLAIWLVASIMRCVTALLRVWPGFQCYFSLFQCCLISISRQSTIEFESIEQQQQCYWRCNDDDDQTAVGMDVAAAQIDQPACTQQRYYLFFFLDSKTVVDTSSFDTSSIEHSLIDTTRCGRVAIASARAGARRRVHSL